MKKIKRLLSLVLCFVMLFSFSFTSVFAKGIEKDLWDLTFDSEGEEFKAAVTMFPGEKDNERIIAWYSASDSGYVELKNSSGTVKIDATSKATPQGDYRLSAALKERSLFPRTEHLVRQRATLSAVLHLKVFLFLLFPQTDVFPICLQLKV